MPPDSQELNLDMLSEDCIALSEEARAWEKAGFPVAAMTLRQIARRYRRLLDALYADGYGLDIPPHGEEPPVPNVYGSNPSCLIIPHYTGQVHRLDATGVTTLCGKTIYPYDYRVVEAATPGQWCAGCFLAERAATKQ